MCWFERLILNLSVLLGCAVLAQSRLATTIRSFQKNLDFNWNEYEAYTSLSDNSNDFFYAACGRINRFEYVCRVTRQDPVSSSADSFKKTCDVWVSNWNTINSGRHVLRPLNHKYALLTIYHHNQNYEFAGSSIYIVRMSDCHVVKLPLPNIAPEWHGKLETRDYEDTFDVFYTNKTAENATTASSPDCQNYICRVTYSLDGKVIQGPTEYLKKPNFESDDHWISYYSSDLWSSKSIYYEKLIPHNVKNKYGLYRLNNGVASKLSTSNTKFSGVSIFNQKFSFCLNYHNGNAICRQYDSEDNFLLNFNPNLSNYTEKQNTSFRLIPYNLREGGMIVVIIEFDANQKIDNLKVLRVRNDGQYATSPLEIPYAEMNLTGLRDFKFLEDNTELCLKLVFKNFHKFVGHEYVIYRIECIPKKYVDHM